MQRLSSVQRSTVAQVLRWSGARHATTTARFQGMRAIDHSLLRRQRQHLHSFQLLLQPTDLQKKRHFSDRSLLGHSPMAPPTFGGGLLQDSTHIPTEHEAVIGAVWQVTTAKRDKLAELKTELLGAASADGRPPDLDTVATERQKLDLWLVDGLQLIAKRAETSIPDTASSLDMRRLKEIVEWIEQKVAASGTEQLHQVQWDELLQSIHEQLSQTLATLPPGRCLQPVRDYFDASEDLKKNDIPGLQAWVEQQQQGSSVDNDVLKTPLETNFTEAALRFRLQTTMAIVSHLQDSWKTFTTVTDQDVDRAAVRHDEATDATTLPTNKLVAVLKAYLCGNGPSRIDALWNLMDKDDDGLLDLVEMNNVCNGVVVSSQSALQQFFQDGLDAAPLHTADLDKTVIPGWRQQRREKKDKKVLTKMFQKTLKRHFEDELEMPHRLRCIYSWANKAHQSNKIDSVLVEDEGGIVTSVVGRKRFVELHPKIAVSEFRQVQTIHFPHLDRVGPEYLHSFREDLLLHQGKGRQNRELLRDCTLFFTAVCAIDFIVLLL